MPIYKTRSIGVAHRLDWFATVEIPEKNIIVETAESTASKTSAEQSGAKLVLDQLQKSKPKEKIALNNFDSVYLIDLENRPSFNGDFSSKSLYVGFHNSVHHAIPKYKNWHQALLPDMSTEINKGQNNCLLYLIEGGVTDLVDHFMTMFVWPVSLYLKENPDIKIVYVVSGDKAGFCTKICLEKALEWNHIHGVKIKNISSINSV